MDTHYPPAFKQTSFNCPHCQVFATQLWGFGSAFPSNHSIGFKLEGYQFAKCGHCEKVSCWFDEKMIMPTSSTVPPANREMPDVCKDVYNEARDVVARSPKAAAALLRLALQMLMSELGEKGKDINTDIQKLVDKGLDPQIQAALDYCRLVGNNAVHPGEIDFNETPEIAHTLFEMINLIVEDRIARPKKMGTSLSKLPAEIQKKIQERADKAAAQTPPN